MISQAYIGSKYFINTNLVSVNEEKISETDSNATVLYEIFRVINGKPLFLSDHYSRLNTSYHQLYSKCSFTLTESDILKQIAILSHENKIYNSNIELSLICNSEGKYSYAMGFIKSNYPKPELYKTGVEVCLLHEERTNPNVKAKGLKVRDHANALITEKGVFEVLLVNNDGILTEGSRSNLFLVKGDTIYTATDERVLLGITRKHVSAIIEKLGYKTQKQLHYTELDNIEGAFLTGTSIGVLPICKIESISVNPNNEIVQHLVSQFKELENDISR